MLRAFGGGGVCGEQIQAKDLNGNDILIPRFACNLVLQRRRSVGDVIRGIRNGARLYLTYGSRKAAAWASRIRYRCNSRLSWAGVTPWSLNGGWPSYEFGDGGNGFSSILRRENGSLRFGYGPAARPRRRTGSRWSFRMS